MLSVSPGTNESVSQLFRHTIPRRVVHSVLLQSVCNAISLLCGHVSKLSAREVIELRGSFRESRPGEACPADSSFVFYCRQLDFKVVGNFEFDFVDG